MRIETIVYTDDNAATTRVIVVEYSGALAAMKAELEALRGKRGRVFVYDDEGGIVHAYSVGGARGCESLVEPKRSLDPDGMAVVMREIRDALAPAKCINIMGRYRADERAFVLRTLAGQFKVTVEPLDVAKPS